MMFTLARSLAPGGLAAEAEIRAPARPRTAHVPRADGVGELAALVPPLRRVLRDDFDVGDSSNRFCPLLCEDGSVVILTLEAFHDSEQVDELARMVVRRRYRLAEPARIVVPATLLLALVRGQIDVTSLRRGPLALAQTRRSAMSDAFHDIVAWGVAHDASDIHLNVRTFSAESEVRFSVAGRYVAPDRFARMPTITLSEILAVAWMDVSGGNGAVFDPQIEQQGRIRLDVQGAPVMLRWASLAADQGVSVCLRILRLDRRVDAGFDALGYLPTHVDMLDRARACEGGAIVLAGVVGSGKSTTIAALMGRIARTRKVITLEDPVEYLIPGALQNTVVRALDGERRDAFDAKLKTVKRSAMDDLLVGEIRDIETGRAFLDLAGSGISLYTTVHAGAASRIPDRLASEVIGVSRDFLATPGILKLLVYQALIPRLCQHCAVPLAESSDVHAQLAWRRLCDRVAGLDALCASGVRVRHVPGCDHCRAQGVPELHGYDGRTVVAEMLEPATDDIFLDNLRRCDNLAQRRHLARLPRTPLDDPDMRGKSALACAVFKMLHGQLDPVDVLARCLAEARGPGSAA